MSKKKKISTKRKSRKKKLLIALEPYTVLVPPKPQTVEDAWDAMKAAGELPRRYRVAEPIAEISEANQQTHELFFADPPKDGLTAGQRELKRRALTKKTCLHERTNSDGDWTGNLNIKWHEHSNHIINGVCGTCFSPFDTRDTADNEWFLKDPRAAKTMGRAGEHAVSIFAPVAETPPPSTRWQKFVVWAKKIFR